MSNIEVGAYWAQCDKLADEVGELRWLLNDMRQTAKRASWAYAAYDICGDSVDALEKDIQAIKTKLSEKHAEWTRLLNSDTANEAEMFTLRPMSMRR